MAWRAQVSLSCGCEAGFDGCAAFDRCALRMQDQVLQPRIAAAACVLHISRGDPQYP